jgi:signal transduction histidine kinase
LFLAFEETLNNVLKHSGASKVKVEMTINAPKFEIIVTDNGKGFEAGGAGANGAVQNSRGGRGGNGLRNIRQRLTDIGGEGTIRSQPGAGTTVSLFIRLNASVAKKS